jgi:hypothetical protein
MTRIITKIIAPLSVIGSLLLIFGLMIFVIVANYNNDENKYNNGVCTVCEGHYHFVAADRGYYYYHCDKCESVIEVRHLMNKN